MCPSLCPAGEQLGTPGCSLVPLQWEVPDDAYCWTGYELY